MRVYSKVNAVLRGAKSATNKHDSLPEVRVSAGHFQDIPDDVDINLYESDGSITVQTESPSKDALGELREQIASLTARNIELQGIERELRQELAELTAQLEVATTPAKGK